MLKTPCHLQSGFTLIELIMVIALLGLISTFVSQVYVQGLIAIQTQSNITDALSQGSLAMERLIRDISETRTAASITTMTATQLTFTNNEGTSIAYALSGNNLTRNGDILATGISSISFTYITSTNTTAATAAAVDYITITLNINRKNTTYTFNSAVYLRDVT